MLRFTDEENALRVAIIGADATAQLFGTRESLGETVYLNGLPYTVIGKIRKKDQDSNYSGPDNDKVFVPFAAMMRDFPRTDAEAGVVSNIIVTPQPWVLAQLPDVLNSRTGRIEDIDWPLEREIRRVLAPRHRFDPADRNAIAMWDTTLQTLMFGRMIEHMKLFFTVVGVVTLSLGGLGVMNIMLVAVRERTREIGVRKALGATTGNVQRQFFLEGFILTMLSGSIGFGVALGLCSLINLLPMPTRFSGMVITTSAGLAAVAALTVIGVITSTYPARRAALLPPVEALRYEGH
jgi:putative ABC transport system permease protein